LNRVVNSTDKKALVRAISRLSEIHGGIADLRHQLCERISEGPTKDSSFLRARTTMERLAITIPRRIEVLREKDKRLDSFMGKRDKALVSMQSIKSDLDEAKRRPDFQQRLTAIKKIHLSVVNMQYEVNRVLNEHAVLEQEVASSQFDVDPELSCKMHTFKDSWTKLSSEIRHLTAGGSIVSEASESGVELSATESGQQASVVQSPSSHTSGESCVSRTTYSQSSFHSEEAHLDVDDIACKVERELQQMLEEATASNLPVDDPATIRGVVERQQQVMRRLESKRDYLDSLVSTSRSRGGESVSASTDVLQSRVGVLRDQLDVTKHRVLSRKSECTAMASDSEQFARKLNEIDSWLDRLEGILQSTYPVGQTLDVLEHQHQCTMDALKELSKYDHHIKLFMQVRHCISEKGLTACNNVCLLKVCERMVTVYSRDHTQQVVSSRTKVHDQHINLVAEFTKRRNEIQAVQNSFASYDRSIERFFDWLFDIESSVEQLESEASGSPDRQRALRQRFDNIKHEIHDKDRVFNALAKTGNGLLGKMAQEEKMMLSQKLSEMNSRWKALQNKMLGINMAIQSSAQKAATTATDDEQHVPISVQHASLRDHTDWVLRKKRELASLSLDGDVKGLRRQFEEHTSFR
jgi:chromosome segregation ATPase